MIRSFLHKRWLVCIQWLITVVVVLCLFVNFSTVYAACTACDMTPDELSNYFRVMEKILTIVDEAPMKTMADGTESALEEWAWVSFAMEAWLESMGTTVVLATVLPFQITTDLYGEFQTLAGTEARKRDRERFKQLDTKIMQKAIAVSSKARLGRPLVTSQFKKLDTYLKELKYVQLNSASNWYIMQIQNWSYQDILTLVRNMNTMYKYLHQKKWYKDTLEFVGSEYYLIDSLSGNDSIEKIEKENLLRFVWALQRLTKQQFRKSQQELQWSTAQWLLFTDRYTKFATHIWKIQHDYQCAVGVKNQCDKAWKAVVKESRENTKGRFSDGAARMNTFSLALHRLRGALRSKDPDEQRLANQREEALLQSIYGWDIPPERKWFNDNPLLTNGSNPGVWVVADDGRDQIEESLTDSKAVIQWIERRWTKRSAEASAPWDGINTASQPSNVAQDDVQNDANKYPDEATMQAILDETIPESKPVKQDGLLYNGSLLTKKEDLMRASLYEEYEILTAMQKEYTITLPFTDAKPATKQFPILSAAVYRNTELRWKKNEPSDKENGSIYNSMGKVCELQCANLQGKCWYYKD